MGTNTGLDIAGIVAAVGSQVGEFKVGDRIVSFHQPHTPYGAYATFAIATEKLSFHLPAQISFEEGATIPVTATTAAIALFARLGLPDPWQSVDTSIHRRQACKGGVLVYGGSTAVGAFAIKLLKHTGIHPIIAVAGKGVDYVRSLMDPAQGDAVVDYRKGSESLVRELREVIPKDGKLLYALDAVSDYGSDSNIAQVLDPEGSYTHIFPGKVYESLPPTVRQIATTGTSVFGVPDDLRDLGYVWMRLFSLGLREGWLQGHPHQVIPGGLEGVGTGLNMLKEGKASAVKYVYRIEETPGVKA